MNIASCSKQFPLPVSGRSLSVFNFEGVLQALKLFSELRGLSLLEANPCQQSENRVQTQKS